MDASETSRSRSKRGFEESVDGRDRRTEDDEDWEADKRKQRSSKSRRHGTPEEDEEHDGGRRKSSGDKNDGRKMLGSLSHAGGEDEDDYEVRLESRSKISRKNPDDRIEKRPSDGYRDREAESGRRSRDDENEWNSCSRKASTRPSEHESSQSKTRNKVEGSHESEREKVEDRESRYTETKESIREKGYMLPDEERNLPRRRWDEPDVGRRDEESGLLEKSDSRSKKSTDYDKRGSTSNRATDSRNEPGEARGRTADLSGDKGGRSSNREESRADVERSKNSRGRLEARDEDTRPTSAPREARPDVSRDDKQRKMRERSPGFMEDMESNAHRFVGRMHGEKDEKHRQQRESGHGSRDEVESRERSVNMDEDGHARTRDRSGRDIRRDRRSRTPERSERHHRESDERNRGFESDNERSISNKVKEWDEGYRDDRLSRGREGSWVEKNRERDAPKDYWKRSQVRQDTKEGDNKYDHHKERDSQRREQERPDNEKLHSHPGYRRDGRTRPEGRSSSSYRNANETDSIEIKPNMNFDFGREEPGSSFLGRRHEVGLHEDFTVEGDDEEWGYPPEERSKLASSYVDDQQERYHDGGSPIDQNSGRNSLDSQSGKGRGPKGVMNSNRPGAGQSSNGAVQPPFGNNQGPGSLNRAPQQGPKGGRNARGGRGRPNGRDAQRVGIQLPPMMAPPFGHLALPPGPMQPLGPNMPHTPGPPIGPSVFIPQFPGPPLVWPGPRGVDMNILAAMPPNLPPLPPPGPAGPRFAPNMGSGPNHGMYFNQPSPGRGVPPNSGPVFNTGAPVGRGIQHDKAPGGWTPSRNSGPSGKAPSRGEQNDYSQNFVDTGARPQNFIRELELTSVVEDYPKLRELIQRKDEIVTKSASPPMYFKCDLKEHILSPEFFGTKFDVILVDPPWEEYVHRAPGVTDNIECWTFEEIQNLKIEAIADTPSFIFLWVGDGVGLEQGRNCLKKWGFRRCEDICWVKTNKKTPTSALRHDSHTLFQHSKEHCLMGIKGTVRRSTDGHIIHANIDTDIIIAEEPLDASSTKKPDDMYRIIEHFALGRRRLELFGEDHNIRSGWLTVGKGLSSSNFNAEAYGRNFAEKDGKVWQGGGGRNPPPDAPHLVMTTPEIEALRPKSPPPKNQQQQQSTPLLPSSSSNSRRPMVNSPPNPSATPLSGMNQDASGSDPATPVPWPSPMGGLRWPEGGHGGSDDKFSDGYAFNAPFGQAVGDHHEFDPHRTVNML